MIELSPGLPVGQPLTRPISPALFLFEDTCNVYLLRRDSQAIAIDFGAGDLLDELADLGIERITDVLVTHHHRDQVQGLRRAVDAGIRIWVPDAEKDLFQDVAAHWQARSLDNSYNSRQDRFALLDDVPVTGTLADYGIFEDSGWSIQIVPTPGHTTGSITLMAQVDGRRVAFTGDLIAGPGKVWSVAATQWSYNGAEGVAATTASLLDLKERGVQLLLPAHGEPIAQPQPAIDLLIERLERLSALRREPSVVDLHSHPFENVTPHLLRNRTSHSTSYVLLSKTRKALLIDFGYDFTRGLAAGSDRASRRPWLHTLGALKRQFGVTAIDVVIPTHYHDDHVAGFNLLRDVEGTQVWAPHSFADVLENPTAYNLPCLWYEPIQVDRRLPTQTPVAWEEYAITLHQQPGHTSYAVAIELIVDDTRVLFIGDQMGHADGLDLNYVYAGGFAIDDYRKSAELYSRVQPDLLLSGHWQPLNSGLSHLAAILERGTALEAIHRDLLPLDDVDLEAHGPAVVVKPYRSRAGGGQAFTMTVEVRNPHPVVDEVTVELHAPNGWLIEPGKASLWLTAGSTGSVQFNVVAPIGTSIRRARIGVDVTAGKRRLGELIEALVDVE